MRIWMSKLTKSSGPSDRACVLVDMTWEQAVATIDDPLSAFWSAVGQVMGRALLIFATALCGLWLGLSYKQGELIPFDVALTALVYC